jgi:hypothetical protein
MPDLRTTVTELATGLGMLGYPTVGDALAARPGAMVSVSPETWGLLAAAYSGEAHRDQFTAAWDNGRCFLAANDGLRHRLPQTVEWKGSHQAPGDEVVPVDLRVDHVFLVSCKYLSRIVSNSAPSTLFTGAPRGQAPHGVDWFDTVAGPEYRALYNTVRAALGAHELPARIADLTAPHRRSLTAALASGWPGDAGAAYQALTETVATASADRWAAAMPTVTAQETTLWRLLRIGGAPYFLLGATTHGPLRLRVATRWDWRQRYRFRRLHVEPQPGGQPRVRWQATAEDRMTGRDVSVEGHVEIRWSHGRFGGNPEAKVYLDTPHQAVPGYFSLD